MRRTSTTADLGRVARAALLAGGFGLAAAALPQAAFARDNLSDARQSLQKGDLRTAQIQLRNAVRDDPQNAEAHFQLARVSLQLNDPIAAEREARAALDRGYDPKLATPLLAQAYLTQGKSRELLSELPVTGKNPQLDAQILVAHGMAQLEQRQVPEAQKSFADAQTMDPKAIEPLLADARLALGLRDLAKAKAKLDAAIGLEPNAPEVLMLKAQVQRAEGDVPGALGTLNDVLKQNPGVLAARLERAGLLIGTGKDQEAKADIDAVLTALPNSTQALFLRAMLLARARDLQGADAVLTKLIPAMPNMPRAYYLLAAVKESLGQLEQADDAAQKYVARAPNDLSGLKLLATINLAKQRPDRVIEVLSKVVDSGGADAASFDLLARGYAMKGDQAHAVTYYERAAALAPEDPQLRARLAASHLGLGETEAAIGDLEKSFSLSPTQPSSGTALFFADLSTGDMGRTAATLDRIRKAQGETPIVRNMEGLLQMAELDPVKARATFEGIVKDQPDFTPAKINLARIDIMEGDRAGADAMLASILEKQPLSEPALTMLVGSYMQQKKPDNAVTLMLAAHKAAPKDTRLTATLADTYTQTGKPEKALALLSEEGTPSDTNIQLLAARARAQVASKNLPDAQESLRKLLTIAPAEVEPRRGLVALLETGGDVESARNVLQEGMKVLPQNYQFLADYVSIDLKANGLKAALDTADRLQKNASDFPAAAALRGDVYMAVKNYDEAIKAYMAALKAHPSQALVERLSGAQFATGHQADSMATLRDWVAKHPDDMRAQSMFATLAVSTKQYDEAIPVLNKILEKAPRDAVALNNLAWIYQERHDKRAQSLAERAYLLQPSPQTADTLGWILANQGAPQKALGLLRQAAVDSPNPSIQYHLAVALKDAGKKDEAVRVLTPLVKQDQKFDEKDDATKLLQDLDKT